VDGMNKIPVMNITEMLTKAMSSRESAKTFGNLPTELLELLFAHFELISTIENYSELMPELLEIEGFETIKKNLDVNTDFLLNVISVLIGRKILIYKTLEDDTLWKIAKKFCAEIHEISKLNNIKNVITPAEKQLLLIPVKYLR
jgi:hypothetical protein